MLIGFDRFITREAYKYILFGYVNALRYNLPTISIEKAILNFMKFHNLNDDNFNADSARVLYHTMNKEYIEMQKSL